jgi:hypothetical protein
VIADPMVSFRSVIVATLLAATGAIGAAACGTDAIATDGCRKIEQARCRKATSCPDLGVRNSTGVEECVQYARDRCLHGLAVADPGAPAIDACVAAIRDTASCEVVAAPEIDPACAFLKPTPTAPDAATPDAGELDATGSADGG